MARQPSHLVTPGPSLVVRVAGLPMDYLLPLHFTQTIAVIDNLLAKEHKLQARADPLSEALYSVIGTIEDKKIRYQLLALRRAIYHVQMPKPLDAPMWEALPPGLREDIRTWLEQMEQILVLRACGQGTLEEEWSAKRAILQDLAHLEIFQQGLVLASTDLYEDLVRWRQEGPGGSLYRGRQLELGLLAYLSRMATKTSPFSTFMSIGRGQWAPDGCMLTCSPQWQRQSVVTLNWSIAHRIASTIARWPEVRSTLALRVNSSILEDNSQVHFLGWKQALAKKGETVMSLANSSRMQDVLRVIRQAKDPSYAAITQTIAQRYTSQEAAEILHGLNRLIEIGLLELDLGIPDLSSDYLDRLISSLQAFHSQRVKAISLQLQIIHGYLQHYGMTERAAERFTLRKMIDTALERLFQHPDLQGDERPIPIQHAFYEHTLLNRGEVHCSLAHFQEALGDLELLQQLSVLYDHHIPGRLAVAAFFADHYGTDARINVLHVYQDFCREQAQPGGWRPDYRVSGSHLAQLVAHATATLSPGSLMELDQLHQLQQTFSQQFLHQPAADSQSCQLDIPALRAFVARFPAWLSRPRSLAFSCQVLVRNEKSQLVLNTIRSGFGRSDSHLRFLETQIGARAPLSPAPIPQKKGEPLWMDMPGVFGSNASLHQAQTPYEMLYPGTVSARPSDEQLPLNDLDVVYDPPTHCLRLVSRRLQREVLPVHSSFLDDGWQPPLYRFLFHVFGEGGGNPLLTLLQTANTEGLHAELPVQAYPRLYLGRLVLRRAIWLVGVQALPRREKGTSAFEYMLTVQRWLTAHHLPQECFARIPAASTKDRKPLYVDFGNYLSIMLFEQIVHHTEKIANPAERVLLLQEVLPGREDLVLSDGENAYVSEFVIELTDPGHGTRQSVC